MTAPLTCCAVKQPQRINTPGLQPPSGYSLDQWIATLLRLSILPSIVCEQTGDYSGGDFVTLAQSILSVNGFAYSNSNGNVGFLAMQLAANCRDLKVEFDIPGVGISISWSVGIGVYASNYSVTYAIALAVASGAGY